MKIKLIPILFVLVPVIYYTAQAQVKPTPLSNGFIRPATRAFTTIKESTGLGLALAKGPTPVDDRIGEADTAASTSTDKAFVATIKDYKIQKMVFNFLYTAARLTAELKAKTGGDDVPAWECAALEDLDTCPSFQAAVKSLLAENRDLAKAQDAVEDCEDSLANALKTKTFSNAPVCSSKK